MSELLLFFIYIQFLILIKSDSVLELGETQESNEGYIIFNSNNIERDKEINFKIKAYSFTFDFVKYYYITDLDDLNKSEENLFISKFDSEKTENDNNFEINYFTIIKNVSEFNSGEGNYLVIFYFTTDTKAQITNIQENVEEKEEEEKYTTLEYVLIAGGCVILIIIIYCCCCKKNEKKNEVDHIDLNPNSNQNYNNDFIPVNNEYSNYRNNAIIPYINPPIENLHRIIMNQNEEMEFTKKENERLKHEAEKRENERLRLEAEENKRKYLQKRLEELKNKQKEILSEYVKGVRKKYPDFNDVVIVIEGNIDIKNLISITFQSGDQTLKCIVICRKNEIFNVIVNKIFEKIPQFKEYKNYFLGKGKVINEYQSLEENNIIDETGIVMEKQEDN